MTKSPSTLKAAIYARYSSDMQKDTSVEDQFSLLEKVAPRFNLKLDKRHYYADRAQTATTLFDRPGLTRDLMNAAQRGEFNAIIFEQTDRLSRDKADLFWLAKMFDFYKVQLFNQNGPVTDLQLLFEGHGNEDFIKKLAARVKRGHDAAAEKGRFVTAPAYGYDPVPGKPGERVINEFEAAIVRRIFTMYSNGMTPREIVAGLAKSKVPSPSGAPFWNHQTIVGGNNKRGLIHNRLYIGEYVKNRSYNVKNPTNGKRMSRKADESELIVYKHPNLRIIDQALWDAAHQVRVDRGVKVHGGHHTARATLARKKTLLSGLLRCDACGGLMTVTASARNGQRVSCSTATYRKTCDHKKTYDLNTLTAAAVDHMHKNLTDPEFVKRRAKAAVEEFAKLSKRESEERKIAQKQLDRLNVQIRRLADAIADSDDMPIKELMKSIKDKEIERSQLEERIRILGVENNVTQLDSLTLASFGKKIDTLAAKLKKNPDDPDCRYAFQNIIDSIVVHPTAKGEAYEISLYARMSAVMGAVDLFPARRSAKEVVAAERIGLGNTASSFRPQPQQAKDLVFLGRFKLAA